MLSETSGAQSIQSRDIFSSPIAVCGFRRDVPFSHPRGSFEERLITSLLTHVILSSDRVNPDDFRDHPCVTHILSPRDLRCAELDSDYNSSFLVEVVCQGHLFPQVRGFRGEPPAVKDPLTSRSVYSLVEKLDSGPTQNLLSVPVCGVWSRFSLAEHARSGSQAQ